MPEVRVRCGAPLPSDFAGHKGTPIVVDEETGVIYVMGAGGVVRVALSEPVGHEHPIADVAGLQAALDAASAALVAHEAANDPHPGYLTQTDADALYDGFGASAAAFTSATVFASGVVAAHADAADPHGGYQKESERGQANGYASLGADGKVPAAQLPAGQGGASWGDVEGDLADQADLQDALDAKAAASHDHDGAYAPTVHTHAGLYEPANANIQAHVAAAHAPANAQKNSDITKAEIEAKLTGVVSSHSHAAQSPFMFEGVLAADVTTGANVNPVNVTGLVFTFTANKNYVIEIFGSISSAAATTGCGLQFDTSVAVTQVAVQFFHQLANTGTLTGGNSIADDASAGVSSGINANGAIVPVYGAGILRAGANGGTAQLRYRSETTAATTIKAGTVMRVRELP